VGDWLQPLWITLPIAAGCCHYCVVHAKLDFVSVFGLNYFAALCASVETTVRILMVNSCGIGSSGHGSVGQRFLPGRVRSRVSVTDPVSDPVL